ncbi:MAG: hypothetical protein OYL41_11130 [Acidobacteriota bacterium]|nr:hypothetical protein [Acidobacteriota bacterium]MDE3262521.1 hypothetical protein [Acidobacteriota bacterium]
MLDTLAVAREMTAGGIDRDQAEAIANAMRKVAEQGDHVTSDQFKAGQAEVRAELAEVRTEFKAELAALEARLTWRFAGAMLAQTGVILAAVIGAAVAILRMFAGPGA